MKVFTIINREYHDNTWLESQSSTHAELGAKHSLFAWSVVKIENLVLELLLPPYTSNPVSLLIQLIDKPSEDLALESIHAEWLTRFDKDGAASSVSAMGDARSGSSSANESNPSHKTSILL